MKSNYRSILFSFIIMFFLSLMLSFSSQSMDNTSGESLENIDANENSESNGNSTKDEINISNDNISNIVYVDSLGAHGDGVTDDTPFIQAAFDSGNKVVFGDNKKYKLVSNGIKITNQDIVVEGNNSHIIVDDSYSPSNPDFQKYVFRGSYTPHDSLRISNLYFDINCSQNNKYSGSNYLCVIHPLFFDHITLDNVNVNIASSENNITAFWMYYGCQQLAMNNCNFTNNTTSESGGILFLHARTDNHFSRYNSFDNVQVNNCIFSGTCGDEAIGIWGVNNVNATFNSCTVNWNRACTNGISRPISINSSENGSCTFNVQFKNSNFFCNSAIDSTNCDSFLGVGTVTPSTIIRAKFDNCSFDAHVHGSFLRFQLLNRFPDQIPAFDYCNDRYDIAFSNCDITCNKTITGCNSFYDSSSLQNPAIDCAFDNCSIRCKYCVAMLECYSNTPYYYVPRISLTNNNIAISDSLSVVYMTSKSACGDISMSGNSISGSGNLSDTGYRYQTEGSVAQKQRNAP
ncbi:MAG: hypothetical protein E7307_02480 [Butyrivibrio sp.]|nr:hypothetical protein [Butyrivibrio sp.]